MKVTDEDVQRDECLIIVDGQLVRAHEAIAVRMEHMDDLMKSAVDHATSSASSSD